MEALEDGFDKEEEDFEDFEVLGV
ncbi:hypothetical protein CCACVL1_05308 [Corchorus capsularis]|uniref:Uncharacterized protein n=1 Tax=Corchorus capsularis TaxID=210143 RepID=A0A1R3JLI5_COCAP|nr:hypothetical protein CCACVL1_05308 [Corchorus capsularis]